MAPLAPVCYLTEDVTSSCGESRQFLAQQTTPPPNNPPLFNSVFKKLGVFFRLSLLMALPYLVSYLSSAFLETEKQRLFFFFLSMFHGWKLDPYVLQCSEKHFVRQMWVECGKKVSTAWKVFLKQKLRTSVRVRVLSKFRFWLSSGSGEPWGPGPLAPKISSKSCSFQAILREKIPIFSKF